MLLQTSEVEVRYVEQSLYCFVRLKLIRWHHFNDFSWYFDLRNYVSTKYFILQIYLKWESQNTNLQLAKWHFFSKNKGPRKFFTTKINYVTEWYLSWFYIRDPFLNMAKNHILVKSSYDPNDHNICKALLIFFIFFYFLFICMIICFTGYTRMQSNYLEVYHSGILEQCFDRKEAWNAELFIFQWTKSQRFYNVIRHSIWLLIIQNRTVKAWFKY